MNKICTSIEQSQKLIKLGIDVNTADMCYDWSVIGKEYSTVAQCRKYIDDELPAWSLSALLNYLREVDYFPEINADEFEVTMQINYYNEDEARPLAPVHNIKVKAESFIDACYEIIITLNELKLL